MEARVKVAGECVGEIGAGFAVLACVMDGDGQSDTEYMLKKLSGLRVFEDENDKMNLSVKDVGGEILLISQFTLAGDARHGNRPSFSAAADPEYAEKTLSELKKGLEERGVCVKTGVFRAHMSVELINDGPVTILLDSRKDF